LFTEMHLR